MNWRIGAVCAMCMSRVKDWCYDHYISALRNISLFAMLYYNPTESSYKGCSSKQSDIRLPKDIAVAVFPRISMVISLQLAQR